MSKKFFVLIIMTFFLFLGCSKKHNEHELSYTTEEFLAILDKTGATPDKDNSRAINFSEFSLGVNRINSRPLVYQRLFFSVLEFETVEQAKNEALRLNQYYSRNWLFDKVDGEPILEDMIILQFNAKNPNKRIQRMPLKPKSDSHHDSQGEAKASSH